VLLRVAFMQRHSRNTDGGYLVGVVIEMDQGGLAL
jgi:hypothetical protein